MIHDCLSAPTGRGRGRRRHRCLASNEDGNDDEYNHAVSAGATTEREEGRSFPSPRWSVARQQGEPRETQRQRGKRGTPPAEPRSRPTSANVVRRRRRCRRRRVDDGVMRSNGGGWSCLQRTDADGGKTKGDDDDGTVREDEITKAERERASGRAGERARPWKFRKAPSFPLLPPLPPLPLSRRQCEAAPCDLRPAVLPPRSVLLRPLV